MASETLELFNRIKAAGGLQECGHELMMEWHRWRAGRKASAVRNSDAEKFAALLENHGVKWTGTFVWNMFTYFEFDDPELQKQAQSIQYELIGPPND